MYLCVDEQYIYLVQVLQKKITDDTFTEILAEIPV